MRNLFFVRIIYKMFGWGGAMLLLLSLMGCATPRKTLRQETKEKDSIDVRVEYRIEYRTDTVTIEVPKQTAERTTNDSTSFLENDYSESEARINPDGSLFHSLNSKPQRKPVEVQTPVERKDSIRIEYRDKDNYVEIPVYIEKELSWWQHTSIKFFPYCLAALIAALGWIFRKPIGKLLSIVKSLI